MKKILLIAVILILNNCSGYQPIFSNKQFNFYISEITNINNDDISNQLIRSLSPYNIDNGKQKLLIIKIWALMKMLFLEMQNQILVYEIKIKNKS